MRHSALSALISTIGIISMVPELTLGEGEAVDIMM